MVIEEPKEDCVKDARKIDIGKSSDNENSTPIKNSLQQWKAIKAWHIIEPSPQQLYVAMDLFCPHYQVEKAKIKQYLNNLAAFVNAAYNNVDPVHFYDKEVSKSQGEFLTVINNMSIHPSSSQLATHFSHSTAKSIIDKHKEIGKDDAGQGNIF